MTGRPLSLYHHRVLGYAQALYYRKGERVVVEDALWAACWVRISAGVVVLF
jgi:hypothetical protein